MENILFIDRHKVFKSLRLVLLCAVAGLVVLPACAPKTGATGKTKAQCKSDLTKCNKDCDKLIDVDNNVKNCKSQCQVDYTFCLPSRAADGTTSPLPDEPTTQQRGVEGKPAEK